jgi:surfeit locus 1 family protein
LPIAGGLLHIFSFSSISSFSEPRVIAIEHDYSKRPLQLFWMDALALQAIAESDQETTLLTQVAPTAEQEQQHRPLDHYPRLPALESIAEFKTTPAIHAGYATTWYGLSVAGVFMTRKLITRGRG